MVGILAADDQLLFRFAQQIKVAMHKLDLRVVGLRSRIGKEHVLETVWRDLRQSRRQFSGRLIRALEKVVIERQFRQLISDRLLDAILAISEVAAPQTRHAALNLVAIRIVDIDVLCAADNTSAVFGVVFEVCERMQMMRLIQLLKRLRIERRSHVVSPGIFCTAQPRVRFSCASVQYRQYHTGQQGCQ